MRLNLEFCKSFLKMTKLYLTMMFLTPDVSQEIWQAPLFEHCNKTRKLTKIALKLWHFNKGASGLDTPKLKIAALFSEVKQLNFNWFVLLLLVTMSFSIPTYSGAAILRFFWCFGISSPEAALLKCQPWSQFFQSHTYTQPQSVRLGQFFTLQDKRWLCLDLLWWWKAMKKATFELNKG